MRSEPSGGIVESKLTMSSEGFGGGMSIQSHDEDDQTALNPKMSRTRWSRRQAVSMPDAELLASDFRGSYR